jgi:hypothetical protein
MAGGMIMNPKAIFLPVCTLASLTLFIVGMIPYRRFRAGFRGQVKPQDFDYGESENVPLRVTLPNRNMMNLTEMPVLFYAGTIIVYQIDSVDAVFVAMAWAYVVLRVIHSAIHVTYNKTRHRLIPYGLSNLVLVAFWIRLSLKLLQELL